jgi:hypothetical protein
VRIEVSPWPGRAGPKPTFSVTHGECRILVPEVAEFVVGEGRRIVIHACPMVEPAVLRLFLLGSAWGGLLHQRGAVALHAGVTADGDGAVAFCGPPTAGKSSTVSWLMRHGHGLVSDDLSRLELPDCGPPLVWPSTARLKLSGDALEAAGWTAPETGPAPGEHKFHIPWQGARAAGPLPLRAVYLLSWGEPGVQRLRGIQAVRRFMSAATYRPELLEPADALAQHWRRCVEIARRVPVWELSRRREWSSMELVMEQLALAARVDA